MNKYLLVVISILFSNFILAQNRVGIGTSTPDVFFEVTNDSANQRSNVLFKGGSDTIISSPTTIFISPGTRMLWNSERAAFRVGKVNASEWDYNYLGAYSFAAGISVYAPARNSFSLGNTNSSLGVASFTLGENNVAYKANSYAIGRKNQSDSIGSYSLGDSNRTKAQQAFSIGNNNYNLGKFSFAVGNNNWTNSQKNFLFGDSNVSSSNNMYALGSGNTFISGGYYNFILGKKNSVTDSLNFTIGDSNFNYGQNCFIYGNGNTTNGNFSMAIGKNNFATNYYSQAIGSHNAAVNSNTTAIGSNTRAVGLYATSIGNGTVQRDYSGIAIGMFNDTLQPGTASGGLVDTNNRIFQVGNGTAPNDRKNALTILQTGRIGIGTTQPTQNLTIQKGMNIDNENVNNGTLLNSLRLGNNTTGEAIASRRTAGANQYGIDFYTNNVKRVSISNSGNVGIGTDAPSKNLHVVGDTYITGNIGLGVVPVPLTTNKLEVAGKIKSAQIQISDSSNVVSNMQFGSVTAGSNGTDIKQVTITFPNAFSSIPKLFVTARNASNLTDAFSVSVNTITTTQAVVNIMRVDPNANGSGWGQNLMLDWFGVQ